MNYTGGTFPEQLQSGRVSLDFFKLIGARFEKGRAFLPEEDLPNGEKAVILSHRTWTTRFGSDPEIVGKPLSLDGTPYVVVGVLAPNTGVRELGVDPDVWTAFQIPPNSTDQGHYFRAMGRLKPGSRSSRRRRRSRRPPIGIARSFRTPCRPPTASA